MKRGLRLGNPLPHNGINEDPTKRNNSVGNALFTIGVIEIIAGLLLGVVFGLYGSSAVYMFFLWSGVGIISGFLFIGFAEVIHLLQGIYDNQKK